MVAESTELERLVASWESVERELRNAGYEREADVLTVCRESLASQLDRDGGTRARVLLRVWADDAAVLKTYGYPSAAESLWRCRDGLAGALEADGRAASPASRRPSDGRPGRRPAPPVG